MEDNIRHCLACNKNLRGRTDKKYCDDTCRNHFNNQLRAEPNNLVRNINHALGKNRRILEKFLPPEEQMLKVAKEKLLHEGYQFRYFTHLHTNRKGSTYFFCYDHGFLHLDDCYCILVRNN